MPIVDGKKIVISDSTKKKKPQRISSWHIFTLPQPAPVVLGLFSKRRECWETYPLGGNGSLPWESLSRICPLRPWINSSECWFLEIDELQQLHRTVYRMLKSVFNYHRPLCPTYLQRECYVGFFSFITPPFCTQFWQTCHSTLYLLCKYSDKDKFLYNSANNWQDNGA